MTLFSTFGSTNQLSEFFAWEQKAETNIKIINQKTISIGLSSLLTETAEDFNFVVSIWLERQKWVMEVSLLQTLRGICLFPLLNSKANKPGAFSNKWGTHVNKGLT